MVESICDRYEINKMTLALVPIAHMEYDTLVFEEGRKIYVKQTPKEMIHEACLKGGASYEGRRKAVIYKANIQRKVPIPIDPLQDIFAFPTHSPEQFHCHWIFPSHILSTATLPNSHCKKTIIIFKNKEEITLPISAKILEKQIIRTSYCKILFSNS